jgi:ParB-like chromosome segregation protein Spo0J
MDLQFDQLHLRYAHLRVASPARRGRLLSSISEQGQTTPVLVVPASDAQYVLLDGYMRVSCLMDLGRDTVAALELSMAEAQALVFVHRFDVSARRSSMEEGWLIDELVTRHRVALRAVGQWLGRSTSWVSRRLALVRVLSEFATAAVQSGTIPPHAAAKYLVPLARANTAQCDTLVRALGKERLSDRQVERLYMAWKRADPAGRERIVAQPMLALAASEEVMGPVVPGEPLDLLLGDMDAFAGIGRRARRRIEGGVRVLEPRRNRLLQGRDEVRSVVESFLESLEDLCSM